MLSNYLKVALRNLLRSRGYAFINVAGLALGMASCLLIFLYVQDELAFDRHQPAADRIVRVVNDKEDLEAGTRTDLAYTPSALAPTLAAEFPEVEAAARLFILTEPLIQQGDESAYDESFFLADSTVFDVLHLPLVEGDPETALNEPNTLVLSESAAHRYFGEANPVGQTLRVSNDLEFRVTGVMQDLPPRSHLRIRFLGSFSTLRTAGVPPERLTSWRWQQFFTYARLSDEAAAAPLADKLNRYVRANVEEATAALSTRHNFVLQPLLDIHLRSSHLRYDASVRGNIAYVYAFSLVAVFVLLIACFNFMNLATARSMQRAKEVGVRKVIGARQGQLVGQFLGESVLLALLGLLIAVLIVHQVLPAFNAFTGKAITLTGGGVLWIVGLVGAALLVGILAGGYPAFYLARFDPATVLKAQSASGGHRLSLFRQGMVVAQFAISILLIAGAAVVYKQLEYLRTTSLGFNKEQVVVMDITGERMSEGIEALKAELLRDPAIASVSASWGIPGGLFAGDGIHLKGSETERPVSMFTVDHDYLSTYGMKMAAGRAFSRSFPSDVAQAFILNETAARTFGWTPEQAVGKELNWDMWGSDSVKEGSVIGVVKDFHVRSLHEAVEPVVMHIFPEAAGHLSVRIRPGQTEAALTTLESAWKEWAPEWPFQYQFLDDEFARMYTAEQKMGTLTTLFSGLAILIACMGLFGLATFTAERRRKEIGIRKVLGASVSGVVLLLSRGYALLVLVALVIAAPLAWFAMQAWLDGFAYRVEVGVWPFLLAGAAVLTIALLTVSYHAIRAALADPVNSLRYE